MSVGNRKWKCIEREGSKNVNDVAGNKEAPKLLDATDTLAVGLCHHYKNGQVKSKTKLWEAFVTDNPKRIKKI